MNINSISNFGNDLNINRNRSNDASTADEFSKILDNLKHNRAADYDADQINAEGTTTMTQVMSDGSVLVTVTDANGKIVSQNKTRAMNPDPNAYILDTIVETK